MRASAWKDRGKSEKDTDCPFGLNLGKPSRREYFKGLKQAQVEIYGTIHVFSLARKNFWTTCPELRDEDTTGTPIRDWLERHDSLTWREFHPPHFELVPLGKGQFRLPHPRQ